MKLTIFLHENRPSPPSGHTKLIVVEEDKLSIDCVDE